MDTNNDSLIAEKNLTNYEKKVNLLLEGKIVDRDLDMIAIQFSDGSFCEGYTDDFSPTIPFFHLFQFSEKYQDKGLKIYFDNVKLIYFPGSNKDDFDNNSDKCLSPSRHEIEVTFKDGHVLRGIMIKSRPNSCGFSLLTGQNNSATRVFVVDAAIKKIRDLK